MARYTRDSRAPDGHHTVKILGMQPYAPESDPTHPADEQGLDTIRAMGRPIRMAAFVVIMGGMGLFFWGRTHPGSAAWVSYGSFGLMAAGWLALIYVTVQRSRWVRANPFDPNA